MSQRSIASFFKKGPAAGGSSSVGADSGAKAAKSTLTPEQKQRAEKNRLAALEKLKRKREAGSASPGSASFTPNAKRSREEQAQDSEAAVLTLQNIKDKGWRELLAAQESKSYFKGLQNFLKGEFAKKTIYPARSDIFAAFDLCPLESVKVVIIGQDPYHGPGQAHGLAFSVRKGNRVPPSLRNIYKELTSDIGFKAPQHGYLIEWAKQGVLLLNTVLTVRSRTAFSHRKKGWENFTHSVIRTLCKHKKGIVFLCWGKPAQECADKCVNQREHHVLKSSHPSPLGATKTKKPFIGSRCFSKTNKILKQQGKAEIDWSITS